MNSSGDRGWMAAKRLNKKFKGITLELRLKNKECLHRIKSRIVSAHRQETRKPNRRGNTHFLWNTAGYWPVSAGIGVALWCSVAVAPFYISGSGSGLAGRFRSVPVEDSVGHCRLLNLAPSQHPLLAASVPVKLSMNAAALLLEMYAIVVSLIQRLYFYLCSALTKSAYIPVFPMQLKLNPSRFIYLAWRQSQHRPSHLQLVETLM